MLEPLFSALAGWTTSREEAVTADRHRIATFMEERVLVSRVGGRIGGSGLTSVQDDRTAQSALASLMGD